MDSETIKRGPGRPPKADAAVEPQEATQAAPEPVKLFPVKLLKNYRPAGPYKVVGEAPKGPYPGVGHEDKLWEGTVVELPVDEARKLLENVAVSVEIYRDGSELKRKRVATKFPLAERADAIPV